MLYNKKKNTILVEIEFAQEMFSIQVMMIIIIIHGYYK